MEFTGLIKDLPFYVNRTLTDAERKHQLHQNQRLDIRISHELTVTECNGNWMEIVDKYFFDKGMLATAFIMLGIPCALAGILIFFVGLYHSVIMGDWGALVILPVVPLGLGAAWFGWEHGGKSDFNLTYYPIRLNHQTRMVHVMRFDGSVLSVKWDKVFFTQVKRLGNTWDMVGHVLANDKTTVLETFGLPGLVYGSRDRETIKGYWEFLRRYMEDGPASVVDNITCCPPIKDKKETMVFRYQRLAFTFGPLHPGILLGFCFYPGRWLAMRFSKIPQWPSEIEAECPRPPQPDPYFRDASINKTRFGHLL